MEEQKATKNNRNKMMIIAAVAVIIILAVAAGGFLFMKNNEENSASEALENEGSNNVIQVTPEPTSPNTSPTSYKDGIYTAEGQYTTPGGLEVIGATITLKNNVIVSSGVQEKGKSPTAKVKQADFAANYKEQVVGKNINEVKLTKVSGSSLTPVGFNAALEIIKKQAKSSS